jgi:pimeloyl-ACP methyl ester carboxylesterase
MRTVRIAVFCALLMAGGCASPVLNTHSSDAVIVVPGVGGDGADYAGLCKALADAGCKDQIRVFDWGYHWPLFFINISSGDLHEQTEKKLAEFIAARRAKNPRAGIILIGHSAGAGVILGTLARLDDATGYVGPVILLAPAVSPDYDLKPALRHCRMIHVFFSEEDDFWQGWGPTLTGEYDGTHRAGAGRRGFTLKTLDPAERQCVVQHPFEKQWETLGIYGGHFDWLSRDFAMRVLEPLVQNDQR